MKNEENLIGENGRTYTLTEEELQNIIGRISALISDRRRKNGATYDGGLEDAVINSLKHHIVKYATIRDNGIKIRLNEI
jgi:hypothetical protein